MLSYYTCSIPETKIFRMHENDRIALCNIKSISDLNEWRNLFIQFISVISTAASTIYGTLTNIVIIYLWQRTEIMISISYYSNTCRYTHLRVCVRIIYVCTWSRYIWNMNNLRQLWYDCPLGPARPTTFGETALTADGAFYYGCIRVSCMLTLIPPFQVKLYWIRRE